MRFFRRIYNLCLLFLCPVLCFYYFLRGRADGKYRDSRRSRLGLDLPPLLHEGSRPRIWIHALSVGETLSAVPLLKVLKEEFPETEIVFSTATESGQEIARKRLATWVTSFFYMPHDFPWAMKSLIRRIDPQLFILVETDLWPNLLWTLRKERIPAVLVNGRVSPRSFRRMLLLRPILKEILRCFDAVFAQSGEDRSRYMALGALEGRVHAVGNLKFDAASVEVSKAKLAILREHAGIAEERVAWIAGSTHEGEEEMLLEVHTRLRRQHPELLLIIAPRHVQRAAGIVSLCDRLELPATLRSSGTSAGGKAVYILDSMGELSSFYAFARVAFIGGSMVSFGGHNPLEAAAQGKPALWGPHMFNFREMEAGLIDAGSGRRVASVDELEEVLGRWLADPGLLEQMGKAAKSFFAAHSGAAERIALSLYPMPSNAEKTLFRV
jgi:3-deoxy-D-manno-octulosonic-acid transferase